MNTAIPAAIPPATSLRPRLTAIQTTGSNASMAKPEIDP